ncbi:TetR/AcrR family transcriptional regulator [Rhizobium panacihumi]|uniref:TetR/AcrR family transcriptional regulator n=1 Tax=Rhizobium panacihumi TaxID=2008450 RepID=UPI003D7B428D
MNERSRVTSRGQARHHTLIDAAAELFLEKGYAEVTIDEIILSAGGSKTNVYRQFGGKDGLLAEVVEQLCSEFLSPLSQLELGNVERKIGLGILGRTLLRQLLQPRHVAFQRMVLATSKQFPELMAKWYQAGPRKSQAFIALFLGETEKARSLAVFFHDMIVTDAVNSAMMGKPVSWTDIEIRVDAAAELVAWRIEKTGVS